MDRIAIFLGHPAHFHMFKYVLADLKKSGIEVLLLIKRKDLLEELVKAAGYNYIVVRSKERNSSSKLNLVWQLLLMDLKICFYLLRYRPKMLLGTYCPVISGYLGIPIIVFNEDDAAAVPRFANVGYPRAHSIMAPQFCDCGKWNKKSIKYKGYQKLAYLHPKHFQPDYNIASKYLRSKNKPYVLMRFSKFLAHHDKSALGISNQLALNIIDSIKNDYDVYITSERPLSKELETYRLSLNPLDIHHLMAFASLYVGDSQSMSVEAAMLGTPCIRFNSFAEKLRIGVIDELEKEYNLIKSINSSKGDLLITEIKNMLANENNKAEHHDNMQRMLHDNIDVTAFWVWYVLNFPESDFIVKNNPDKQYDFLWKE